MILTTVEELLLAANIVMALALLWAIAAPCWVESLFKLAVKKLYAAIAVGVVAVGLIAASIGVWRLMAR